MVGRALAPVGLHPQQNGGVNLERVYSFVPNYNEKAKLRSENDSKLNMFFRLKSEEIANMRKKSAKL